MTFATRALSVVSLGALVPLRALAELDQPALQEPPLRLAADERERGAIGRRGLVTAIEPAQQIRARGVPQVVVGELALELVDERQSGGRTLPHRDRDGAVERDDRRRLARVQHV